MGKLKSIRQWSRVVTGKKSKNFVIGTLGLVLVIAVGAWLWTHQFANRNANTVVITNCSSSMLHQASQVFDPTKVADLGRIVGKIQTIKGYDKDPNCLYVVTIYYINRSDPSQARHYVDKLNATYDGRKGLNPALQPSNNLSLTDLNDTVTFLEANSQQGLNNARGSENP